MKTSYILLILGLPVLVSCTSKTVQSDKQTAEFRFHYSCDTGDEADTFEGYIIKDLNLDGKTKVHFKIPPESGAAILAKLEEIHFFEMKSPYPSRPWVGDKPVTWPNSLRVVLGDQEKYIEWDNIVGIRTPVKELRELRGLILNIMRSSPEWKLLPPVHNPRL